MCGFPLFYLISALTRSNRFLPPQAPLFNDFSHLYLSRQHLHVPSYRFLTPPIVPPQILTIPLQILSNCHQPALNHPFIFPTSPFSHPSTLQSPPFHFFYSHASLTLAPPSHYLYVTQLPLPTHAFILPPRSPYQPSDSLDPRHSLVGECMTRFPIMKTSHPLALLTDTSGTRNSSSLDLQKERMKERNEREKKQDGKKEEKKNWGKKRAKKATFPLDNSIRLKFFLRSFLSDLISCFGFFFFFFSFLSSL